MRLMERMFGGAALRRAPVAAPAVARAEPVLRASSAPPAGATEAGFSSLILGQSRVKSLPPVSPRTAERHATVFACGNVIAGDLMKVPLLVWQRNRDGTEAAVEGHPLTYLLNTEASPGVPATAMRYALVYAFAIRGRSYAYAPRDGAGELELVEVLHPDLVAERRTGRDRFYSFTDGAEVQRTVAARQMVHLRYMAEDGWTGRSPLQVAAESVGLALAGQEAAARSASGTHMRAFVKMDDYFEDEEAATRSALRVRGQLNDPDANGIPLLEKGEIKSLDLSAADQELLASRKFDREQIAAIYRVTPSKLQMLEFGVKANGQQQAIDHKTDCLLHWGGLAAAFMAQTLLTPAERAAGMTLVHDWDALMEPTMVEAHNAIKVAVGGPIMTPNEGRKMRGLPPVPGGNVLYPPANMTADAGALAGAGDGNGGNE
ncbi:phage portal protein [Paragemmobacter ruber]|uniref:Phage portal protein n=1 Tax=Paragemmobacter ruber TaxID=1985673 RepID=A0ABW9Y0B4_9RHOB|nr:phage portal protein [Rhodobacter ruber]NBE05938.1 phage portal protein [Rhodobacter ruber]